MTRLTACAEADERNQRIAELLLRMAGLEFSEADGAHYVACPYKALQVPLAKAISSKVIGTLVTPDEEEEIAAGRMSGRLPQWLRRRIAEAKLRREKDGGFETETTPGCEANVMAAATQVERPYIFGHVPNDNTSRRILATGGSVVIIGGPEDSLPLSAFGKTKPEVAKIQRFTAQGLLEVARALYGEFDFGGVPEGDWVRRVEPADFPALPRESRDESQAQGKLDVWSYVEWEVRRRLEGTKTDGPFVLTQLPGLGAVRHWVDEFVVDVASAMEDALSWDDLEKGFLFSGPPGCGKTSLAVALGSATGLPVICGSLADWQSGKKMDGLLEAIAGTFAKARLVAPSILFIDEIDSFGVRSDKSGTNKGYEVEVINALLQQVSDLLADAKVIIIGATNYEDEVDPALKRPGRLGRTVRFGLPDAEGLSDILLRYLGDEGELSVDELRQFGELAIGMNGATVRQVAKAAIRRAKRAGNRVCYNDVLESLTEADGPTPEWDSEVYCKLAYHEAGHVVANWLGPREVVQWRAVILGKHDRCQGLPVGQPESAERLKARLEWLLAGRAAEEVVFGPMGISDTGQSELRLATELAMHMAGHLGMGGDQRLRYQLSKQLSDMHLHDAIEPLLQDAYARVKVKLEKERRLLDYVQQAVLQRRVLDGQALREICAQFLAGQAVARAGTSGGRVISMAQARFYQRTQA